MIRYTLVALFVLAFSVSNAFAQQATFTGSISSGDSTKYYRFTPAASGQFTATLSWDSSGTTLALILVCGTSDPQSFGIAAGQMDRLARLESGLIGQNGCLLGVATLSGLTASYRLTLQSSTTQTATAQSVSLAGVSPAGSGALDARLIETVDRSLDVLRLALPR